MPKCYRTLLAVLAAAALLPGAAAAVVIPISQLHCNDANGQSLMTGQTVTIQGTVTGQFPTTGVASSTRLYIQDGTGGVNVYGTPLYCGSLGDYIVVTGLVSQYRGLVEVASPPTLTINVVATGAPQPTPVLLTIAQIKAIVSAGQCELYESMLVGVLNCYITAVGGGAPPATFDCTLGQNLELHDVTVPTNFITLRINKDMPNSCSPAIVDPLHGRPIPTGVVSVIGVLSQYSGSTAPFNGGWQLMPRSWTDVQSGTTPTPTNTWGKLRKIYR